jgi:hypothetical protein
VIRLLATFFVLFLANPAFSEDRRPPLREKKFAFSILAGARASSNLARRGATLYDSWQLSPFLYFGFFNDRLLFLVTDLQYNDFLVPELVRGRTEIASVTDRPFFKTGGEPTSFRNQRPTSYEWTNSLEIFLPDRDEYWAELDLSLAKDLKAHSGFYLEVTPRITLARLLPDAEGKPRFLPQTFMTLGWGDSRHNAYQYGAGAKQAGWSTLSYGLMVVAPEIIDSHFPVLTLSRYYVLGDAKNGSLVADKTSGFTASALIAFAITK